MIDTSIKQYIQMCPLSIVAYHLILFLWLRYCFISVHILTLKQFYHLNSIFWITVLFILKEKRATIEKARN